MRLTKSPFDGIDKVDISGSFKDPFLRPKNVRRDLSVDPKKNIVSSDPAEYLLQILSMEWVDSKNPLNKGASFVKTKFRIFWTDGDMPINSDAVYLLDTSGQYFTVEMARLVCNSLNAPPETLKPEHYEQAIGPTNPMSGKFVHCKVSNTKSSKSQNDFSAHWFSPIGVSLNPDGSYASMYQVENKVGASLNKAAA